MFNSNDILTERDKKEGFSTYIQNNFLNLYFNDQKIAVFIDDGLGRQKVRCFITLSRVININQVNISNRISSGVETFIEDKFCQLCGRSCKKLCKMAQIMYEQLFYQNWLEYVQMN